MNRYRPLGPSQNFSTGHHRTKFRWSILIFAGLACLVPPKPLQARKTNQAVYEEPFDLAAGGASLTRASQEGILHANPALLPLGGAWLRWVGFELGLLGGSGGGSGSLVPEIDASNPLDVKAHVGQSFSLSFLNKNFGISVFDRVEIDLEGQKYGDGGLPAVELEVEAYAGGVVSFATRPLRWLSLGVTTKYLYAGEPVLQIPIADTERIDRLSSDPNALQDLISFGQGVGLDVGTLVFLQGKTFDFSFATKVDDVGDTKLEGRSPFKQTVSAGLGFALHGSTEVLHLSLDYRDILNVHDERLFKKVYAGARVMLRQMIGLAAGYYQGIPTVGIRLDLVLLKAGLTIYGRELGDFPGEKQRNLYYVYTGMGF